MTSNYIITTAQRGATPNWNFLRGLETYAQNNDSEIIVLLTNGRYPKSDKLDQNEPLHPYFSKNFSVVTDDMELSNAVDIRYFPVKAQQMDPTTSWGRFVQDKTAIMPSPKQRMKVIPTSNTKYPKVLMSTGAVTEPNYKPNSWGTKAELDHVYGAIVLELDDQEKFHYRQLRASRNGVFYDLGVRYDGEKSPLEQRVDALVMGDLHTHQVDPTVLKTTYELIKDLKPKNVLLHDVFDGYSISHHDGKRLVTKATKSYEGATSLEEELYELGKQLDEVKEESDDARIVVVKGNHDEVIDRYLQEGRFVNDPQNVDIALKLFQALREGKDPVEEGVRLTYGRVNRVKYLSRDDDFKVRGWQLANHGDLGANGARASVRSLENACSKSIVGHSHSPQIFRNVFIVGTTTPLKLDYNRGPSSWMNTHALIHPNGQPQLVNIVDGEYKKLK